MDPAASTSFRSKDDREVDISKHFTFGDEIHRSTLINVTGISNHFESTEYIPTHNAYLYSLTFWTIFSVLWIVMCIYFQVQASIFNMNGTSQTATLQNTAACALIYGILLFLLSIFGHITLYFKFRPLEAKTFTTPAVFICFLSLLMVIVVIEFIVILTFLCYIFIARNNPSSHQSIERLYSFMFNEVFFSFSTSRSNSSQPERFWDWVATHCPASLQADVCIKYYYFSPGNCGADWNLCLADKGFGFACPYNICRQAVLEYSSWCLSYACFGGLVFFSLHVIALVSGYYSYKEAVEDFNANSIKFNKLIYNPRHAVTTTSQRALASERVKSHRLSDSSATPTERLSLRSSKQSVGGDVELAMDEVPVIPFRPLSLRYSEGYGFILTETPPPRGAARSPLSNHSSPSVDSRSRKSPYNAPPPLPPPPKSRNSPALPPMTAKVTNTAASWSAPQLTRKSPGTPPVSSQALASISALSSRPSYHAMPSIPELPEIHPLIDDIVAARSISSLSEDSDGCDGFTLPDEVLRLVFRNSRRVVQSVRHRSASYPFNPIEPGENHESGV